MPNQSRYGRTRARHHRRRETPADEVRRGGELSAGSGRDARSPPRQVHPRQERRSDHPALGRQPRRRRSIRGPFDPGWQPASPSGPRPPEPELAQPGRVPAAHGCSFEPKWMAFARSSATATGTASVVRQKVVALGDTKRQAHRTLRLPTRDAREQALWKGASLPRVLIDRLAAVSRAVRQPAERRSGSRCGRSRCRAPGLAVPRVGSAGSSSVRRGGSRL
jgi:hypothetical protein